MSLNLSANLIATPSYTDPAHLARSTSPSTTLHALTTLPSTPPCPLGGFCHTWLGPNASKPAFFAERIRTGDYLGKTALEGQRCDLVLCQPTGRYGGIELFYVRPGGLVVRWDTFRQDEGDPSPTHKRSRIYHRMSSDPLPADTWHFEMLAPDDVDATKMAYQAIDDSMREQNWREALRVLDGLLDKRPQDLDLLRRRFTILAVGLKNHNGAVRCAEQLFTHVNQAPGFLNEFAWALLTQEQYGGHYAALALKWSEESNRLTDYASWPFLDTLARVSFETGDAKRAISLQEKAIKLCSWENPELEETLARYRTADTDNHQTAAD